MTTSSLQTLLSQLPAEVALPLLNTAFASIEANPTATNVAAQGAALSVSALAALPTLEGDAIKAVAVDAQAKINAALGKGEVTGG